MPPRSRGARTMWVQCFPETKVIRGPSWPSNRTKVMLTTAKPSPALAQQKAVNQADYYFGLPLPSQLPTFLNQLISAIFRNLALSLNLAEKISGCARTTCLWSCLGGLGSSILALRRAKRNMTSPPRAYLCKSDCIVLYPSPWHEPEATDQQ